MNSKARFSGRQNYRTARGSERVIKAASLPACYRKRFRTGLNSVAGYAGSLSDSYPNLLLFSAISITLFFFAACSKSNQPLTNAQSPTVSNVRSSADVVKVTAPNISIPAGGNADATLTISILPGYHINANPATFSYLIATEVKQVPYPDNPITFGTPVYPSAVKKKFAFAERPLAVYEGDVAIKLPVNLADSEKSYVKITSGARLSLPLDIRVQACDQEKCFPPDTLHATIAVEVK
jgi:hypothetical protein